MAAQAVTERDAAHQDIVTFRALNQRLQAAVHHSQPRRTDAKLQEWCARAEVKVAALQKDIEVLKEN